MSADKPTNEITPGERRELRSVVKGRYKVLRAEVSRREKELQAEVESELLRQYRGQDDAIAEAKHEMNRAMSDYILALQKIAADLKEKRPELTVEVSGAARYGGPTISAADENRAQVRRALIAAIPDRVGDAKLNLDRQEIDHLTALSAGALQTDQARGFLEAIPTVGELIPRVRLRELEAQMGLSSNEIEGNR